MKVNKVKKRFSLVVDQKQPMSVTNQLPQPIVNHPVVIRPAPPVIRNMTRLTPKSKDSNNSTGPGTPPGHRMSPVPSNGLYFRKGWLWKWTNYIKGYQKRWFVLKDGTLSYYRNKEDMLHTCRGSINLSGAYIETMSKTYFVVRNGTSQVFHLKASTEEEKQQWVTELDMAKSNAIRNIDEDYIPIRYTDNDLNQAIESPLEALENKLQDFQSNYDTLQRKGQQLLQVINTGDALEHLSPVLKEKFTLYSLTATTLIKKAKEYYDCAADMYQKCQRTCMQEEVQREELVNQMESLASQLVELERQCLEKEQGVKIPPSERLYTSKGTEFNMSGSNSSLAEPITVMSGANPRLHRGQNGLEWDPEESLDKADPIPPNYRSIMPNTYSDDDDDDDDEFFDAATSETIEPVKSQQQHAPSMERLLPQRRERSKGSIVCGIQSSEVANGISTEGPNPYYQPGPEGLNRDINTPEEPSQNFVKNLKNVPTIVNRRTSIIPKPNVKLSYWAILKKCIGKDLSKIPMPVHFNEPLSLLQRLLEEFEYSNVLDTAANERNSLEQMCFVVGFTVSAYSTTIDRTTKPFNPLLGETYECDRRNEMGWRVLMEQVSHHPPALAMYAEHKDWLHWQDFTASSKFRGKYLTVIPQGVGHLIFYKSGNHYTWRKVTTTVHNIIVGRLWIDQHGEMEIINHKTKERCVLKYIAYSYFSRERHRKVSGAIFDAKNTKRFVLRGYWDEFMEYAPVTIGADDLHVIGEYKRCWTRVEHKLHEDMYNFTDFALQLNELEHGIAPTDSRFRPDQRLMENGDFDQANAIKHKLEEKQRAKRRARESLATKALEFEHKGDYQEASRLHDESDYKPYWFEKRFDPCTNTLIHMYKGGYWETKESTGFEQLNLPDLY